MNLEKIVLPLAQVTKFYYWLFLYYIFSLRVPFNYPSCVPITSFSAVFPIASMIFLIAFAELLIGIADFLPKEEFYIWILPTLMLSILFGGYLLRCILSLVTFGFGILDLLVLPDSVILLVICTITLVEFLVRRNERIKERYGVKF
jgi:hypothetical protein